MLFCYFVSKLDSTTEGLFVFPCPFYYQWNKDKCWQKPRNNGRSFGRIDDQKGGQRSNVRAHHALKMVGQPIIFSRDLTSVCFNVSNDKTDTSVRKKEKNKAK
jgi:hypothetical protein